jgi:hypothetical protein
MRLGVKANAATGLPSMAQHWSAGGEAKIMFALVDGNNFSVSCERVFRRSLEGRPVVVLSNNDGCYIAHSNEAKDLGVKLAQPWHEVRHLEESDALQVQD